MEPNLVGLSRAQVSKPFPRASGGVLEEFEFFVLQDLFRIYRHTVDELDRTIAVAAAAPPGTSGDGREFATTLWTQIKIVTHRMNISLYRNTDYINNKVALHVILALFGGFSFWSIGNSVADLQLDLFTVFNTIFVAPGVIAQLQPLFIERRDIYETREKKSKMYSWVAFTTGLIVSEFPYLCLCGTLYFVCWYWTVGWPNISSKAGGVFFVIWMYEFMVSQSSCLKTLNSFS